ncbi:TPA: hypothetical protein ACJTJN_004092 [Klebsiella pneumoniae]
MTSKLIITRERLQELAAGQSGFNLRTATHEESQELASMALAAMGSEPVGYTYDELNAALQLHRLKVDGHSQLSDAFRAGFRYARRTLSHPAPVVMDDRKLRALFDSWFASDCSFDLSPEASEADNIAWRESYWYVWQRCRSAMLQESQKSAGASNNCRSSENVQVMQDVSRCSTKAAPALDSPPKTAESRGGNSPVIPDGSVAMLRRWLVFGRGMQNAGSQLPHNLIAETESMLAAAPTGIPMIPDGYVMVPKDLLSELRDWAHPEIEKYCEMWEGRRDSEFPALREVIADADALLAASPQEVK